MIITAKYSSICPACNASIQPGTKVDWERGSKARHATCAARGGATAPSAPPPATRAPRRGKWTGCSCGSREDSYGTLIPSPRNCSSCEHDA